MICTCQWFFQKIINIVFHQCVHEIMKYGGHSSLIGCACIFQSKGHDIPIVCTPWAIECCLMLVFKRNTALIISWESIHEGQHLVASREVYYDVYSHECEVLLWTCFVQVPEICADMDLSIRFGHWYKVWNLICIVNRSYETDIQ